MTADGPNFDNYERLVRKFAPEAKLVEVRPLHGGLSTQAVVLEVTFPHQQTRKFVVRRPPPWMLEKNPEIARTEYQLVQSLYSMGIRVQQPIHLDSLGEFLGTPSLTLEYIEAATDFSPTDLKSSIEQMATRMAEFHGLDMASFAPFLPPKDVSIPPVNAEAAYSDAEIMARNFSLKAWPRPFKNSTVLVHGDYWPGNILWKGGNLSAILDWEQAGLCDPLYDVAVARLDIFWLFGWNAMEQFTRDYAKHAKVDFSDLPYWDLRSALRANGKFAVWASVYPGLGRPDVTVASMIETHRRFVEAALKNLSCAP